MRVRISAGLSHDGFLNGERERDLSSKERLNKQSIVRLPDMQLTCLYDALLKPFSIVVLCTK